MYVQVGFTVNRLQPPLMVPGPSIVNNADGTQIAVIRDGKVHFQKVELGQDFGNTVEVTTGLDTSDLVISNPGERIAEGVEVSVGNPNAADQAPAAPAPKPEKVAESGK